MIYEAQLLYNQITKEIPFLFNRIVVEVIQISISMIIIYERKNFVYIYIFDVEVVIVVA